MHRWPQNIIITFSSSDFAANTAISGFKKSSRESMIMSTSAMSISVFPPYPAMTIIYFISNFDEGELGSSQIRHEVESDMRSFEESRLNPTNPE